MAAAPPAPTIAVSSAPQVNSAASTVPTLVASLHTTSMSQQLDVMGDGRAYNEVVKRGGRRIATIPNVVRGTAKPGLIDLEAAERRKLLHLFYVKKGTNSEQIQAHLNTICGNDDCKVEVLKSRGEYASFKLNVPATQADEVLSPQNWPADICVKPWRSQYFRRPSKENQDKA